MTEGKLPLYVITGFLGSGKTTLIRRLIGTPGFHNTAVIVNEFGEIGLDHELIESVDEFTIVVKGGCVCCGVREDLAQTIRRLVELRRNEKVTAFRRLVVETSGLADPVPVIFTLLNDSRIVEGFGFRGLIVTIDAQNGLETLNEFGENRRQILYANRAVVTKTDLVGSRRRSDLKEGIRALNPSVSIVYSDRQGLPAESLLSGLSYGIREECDVSAWLGSTVEAVEVVHSHGFASLAWEIEEEVDWTAFGIWLTMLLHAHGDRILRVKAILKVEGADSPVAIHGVQHVVHPPIHLDKRKTESLSSRIVFIVKDLDPAVIRRSYVVFASRRAPHANIAEIEAPAGAGRMIGGRPFRRPSAPSWIKG